MKKVLPTILAMIALSQCKEPYNFKASVQGGILVVSGSISDQPGPYPLFLGVTSDSKSTYPIPVLNAVVYLSDDVGNTELYSEVGKGNYQLNGSIIKGTPGRSYKLNFTLKDGRSYQSTLELMPHVSKPVDEVKAQVVATKIEGELGVKIDLFQVKATLSTTFQPNGAGNFRWSVSETYALYPTCWPGSISCPDPCYITDYYSTYHLNVVRQSDFSDLTIRDMDLIIKDADYKFSARHYFNVTQFGMNNACYSYWKKVQQLVENRGSIFDNPPAIIQGNITNVSDPSELVLGYFEASTQQITRKYVDRGDVKVTFQSCNPYDLNFNYHLVYCVDCIQLEGSTFVPPDWFW